MALVVYGCPLLVTGFGIGIWFAQRQVDAERATGAVTLAVYGCSARAAVSSGRRELNREPGGCMANDAACGSALTLRIVGV